MRIAVVDLGTNSARLHIYRVSSTGRCSSFCQKKYVVRLGEDVFSKGKVGRAAAARISAA